MERFNVSENRPIETYLMQGANGNAHLIATPLEGFDAMGNEVAPEFIEQSPYYPSATNYYGYYCTGFDSPGEWDDHNMFFGADGLDVHYTGMQTEGLPYVYYTPSYGYAQSPYNSFDPYIPATVVGVDGSIVGQQYCSRPYQHPPTPYLPVLVQPRPDILPYTFNPTLVNSGLPISSTTEGLVTKYIPLPTSTITTTAPPRAAFEDGQTLSQPASSQMHFSFNMSEGSGLNVPLSRQLSTARVTQGGNGTASFQVADSFSFVRNPHNQLKVPAAINSSVTDFVPNAHGRAGGYNFRPRMRFNDVLYNGNGGSGMLGEQNRGPRTSRVKNLWTSPISVKAHTTKAGNINAQGNIVIHAEQFNRDDFPLNYANARFFVIKSYSEDDVHKSIKYNLWSSTPSGNKRLDSAYEDSQRLSGGNPGHCPIFLFFSVNASGQFCGVAEMIGPVDFEKDMDFWQQDKWSGSFPVKWHMIKDVPNSNFRHIRLENNENKPVTNSRDAQEIGYMHGIEMLKIFKSYAFKTSILDDFMFYEDRQKTLLDEKSRLLGTVYKSTNMLTPSYTPLTKIGAEIDKPLPPKADKKALDSSNSPNADTREQEKLPIEEQGCLNPLSKSTAATEPPSETNEYHYASVKENMLLNKDPSSNENTMTRDFSAANEKPVVILKDADSSEGSNVKREELIASKIDSLNLSIEKADDNRNGVKVVDSSLASILKMHSISRDGRSDDAGKSGAATRSPADPAAGVVTVGSMPVKVNGFSKTSPGVLNFGTISIDPVTLKLKTPEKLPNGSPCSS